MKNTRFFKHLTLSVSCAALLAAVPGTAQATAVAPVQPVEQKKTDVVPPPTVPVVAPPATTPAVEPAVSESAKMEAAMKDEEARKAAAAQKAAEDEAAKAERAKVEALAKEEEARKAAQVKADEEKAAEEKRIAEEKKATEAAVAAAEKKKAKKEDAKKDAKKKDEAAPAPVVHAGKERKGNVPTEGVSPGDDGAANVAMTLRDVVGIGVATNPEYGVVANNRRATDEELMQARALYLPSVDFRADTGYEYTDSPVTRGGTDPDDTESLWRNTAGLTLTQMLFDGWESFYENERQEKRVLSASNRVREAAELIGLATVEAYLEVLRQRDLLKIARDNVAAHMSLADQIKDSTEAGRTTDADIQQSKARLALAQATEASTREALRVAEAEYIRQVGGAPRDLVKPVAPVDVLDPNVDEAVKITLHQNPTIDIFEADIETAHAQIGGARARYFPTFDLQLQGRTSHDVGGVEGPDRNASALVVMNWNLYRGGADSANVREQINREAQAKEDRAKAARGVENDVRQTWARMVSAGDRAQSFSQQVKANSEVVKAYKDQFDLNRRTLLDVLDAQNEFLVSRSNMVNAQYLEMFAVYRLLALKGELLKTLQVTLPREADPGKM